MVTSIYNLPLVAGTDKIMDILFDSIQFTFLDRKKSYVFSWSEGKKKVKM